MGDRENWVDYAKGIGIILVVYGHVDRGLYNAKIDMPTYELVDSIIYSFHMPLFFFLSGLFFYNSFSNKGSAKLIFSKIDTIFYPYVIWSIFQGGLEVLLSGYTNGDLGLRDVLSLLWSPRAQFWFLYALFFIFVFSTIIYSVMAKRFSIVLFFVSLVLYLNPTLLPSFYLFDLLTSNFVFFMLGIMFTLYFKVEYFSTLTTLLGLFFSFVLGQWFFHVLLSNRFTDKSIILFILACISISFVVSLSATLSKANFKCIAYIGSSSMAIYLMHILAGSGSRVILSNVFNVESFILHLIIGCLMGVFLPLIAVFLIKKLNVKFMFSAPISYWLDRVYKSLKR